MASMTPPPWASDAYARAKSGKILGEGAFGKVVTAGKDRVIKIATSQGIMSMVREGTAIQLMDLPFQSAIGGSSPYQWVQIDTEGKGTIIMRRGKDATARLKVVTQGYRRGESQRIVWSWLKDITRILCETHARGIMHRDVKAHNVLVFGSKSHYPGRAFLADWGLAIAGHAYIAKGNPNVYTVTYRPPELLLGLRDYDERADVWALGVMALEWFAGIIPSSHCPLGILWFFFALLGTPTNASWPGVENLPRYKASGPMVFPEGGCFDAVAKAHSMPPEASAFIKACLTMDPGQRPTIFDIAAIIGVTPPRRLHPPKSKVTVTPLSAHALKARRKTMATLVSFTRKNQYEDATTAAAVTALDLALAEGAMGVGTTERKTWPEEVGAIFYLTACYVETCTPSVSTLQRLVKDLAAVLRSPGARTKSVLVKAVSKLYATVVKGGTGVLTHHHLLFGFLLQMRKKWGAKFRSNDDWPSGGTTLEVARALSFLVFLWPSYRYHPPSAIAAAIMRIVFSRRHVRSKAILDHFKVGRGPAQKAAHWVAASLAHEDDTKAVAHAVCHFRPIVASYLGDLIAASRRALRRPG